MKARRSTVSSAAGGSDAAPSIPGRGASFPCMLALPGGSLGEAPRVFKQPRPAPHEVPGETQPRERERVPVAEEVHVPQAPLAEAPELLSREVRPPGQPGPPQCMET